MTEPNWARLFERSKRPTYIQPPDSGYNLDTSLQYVDCNCKARKAIDKHYRYIDKKLHQINQNSSRLRSQQDELDNREAEFYKSIRQLKTRERELDDYCSYLNEKRQNISNMYNKCEILNSQLNDRFNEYNSLQKEVKTKLEDVEKRHSTLLEREEKVDRIAHELDLKQREIEKFQHNFQQNRDYRQENPYNDYQHNKYMMAIEHEKRRLLAERETFDDYLRDMLNKLDHKWEKLDKATNLYRARYDEMMSKERQLNLDRENVQKALYDIEQARIDILKERDRLKSNNVIDVRHVVDNSNMIDKSQQTPHESNKSASNYSKYDKDVNHVIVPQLQNQIADINKLIEDIKEEKSLLAAEKYSLEGQKKRFEFEKKVNERELFEKEQQLRDLESKYRKNDYVEHGTPTIVNGYYNDKFKLGDSSTRFTDVDKDGAFFLDRSTGNYNSYKPLYQPAADRNGYNYRQKGMKDIRDYGKLV